MQMIVNASDVKEIIRDIGYIVIWVWGFKFAMCLIQEVLPKNCKYCGKKAGGK